MRQTTSSHKAKVWIRKKAQGDSSKGWTQSQSLEMLLVLGFLKLHFLLQK